MSTYQRILLTGATGHVGGRLFQHLSQEGIPIVRGVALSSRPAPIWAGSHELCFGDLGLESFRAQVLEEVDVVVHLASRGFSATNQPTGDQLAEEHANTMALAHDAVRANVSRFVFLSSIHVYGKALVGKVDDTTKSQPISEYGASRLRIEEDLARLANETGLEVVVVRMSNSFGVPAFPRVETWDLLLHDLCRQAIQSDSLALRSDPRTSRDVIALRDAVVVLSQIIQSPSLPTGMYLLASGQTSTLLDLANSVRQLANEILGRVLTIETTDRVTEIPSSFHFDCTKLRSVGITIPQHRDDEIRDLLSDAQREFGVKAS